MDKPTDYRAFGDDYFPRKKMAEIVNGKVFGCKKNELLPGKAKQIRLERFNIALFNIGGTFYAIKDACPHANYPLCKGTLDGEVVTCSSHNWKFNLRSGECVRAEGDEKPSIRTFPTDIKGDDVWITLN